MQSEESEVKIYPTLVIQGLIYKKIRMILFWFIMVNGKQVNENTINYKFFFCASPSS